MCKHWACHHSMAIVVLCIIMMRSFETGTNTKVVGSWWGLAHVFAFEKTGKTVKKSSKCDRSLLRYSFFQDFHDLGWLLSAFMRFWPKNHFSSFLTLFPPKSMPGHPLTTMQWNFSKIRALRLLEKRMMTVVPEIGYLQNSNYKSWTFLIRLIQSWNWSQTFS